MPAYECPACKAKGTAPADMAGRSVTCAKCGKPVPVPRNPNATPAPPPRNWLAVGVLAVIGIVMAFFLAVLLTSMGGGSDETSVVVMETSMGKVTIELYPGKAPITVANFLKYVDDKHYDGTIFHRVMPDFMIQGGGFTPGMTPKRNKYPPIRNEAGNGLRNERGALAMARTNDPDSATDQFFINTVDNKFLDRANAKDGVGYAVFGRVTEGMDVVDKIRRVETRDAGGHEAVPVKDVMILSIRRAEAK